MGLKSGVGCAVFAALLPALAWGDELTVWCWDDAFNVPAARLAAARFEAAHPEHTVRVSSIAQDQVVQKLYAALGAENVRGLPDVVLIEDYRVSSFLEGYPGFLQDLSAWIDFSRFADYKVAVSRRGDAVYGVPFDSGVTGLYLRTDLAAAAGLDLEDFKALTWNEFIELGKKIRDATGVKLLAYDPNDPKEILIALQSGGEWYTAPDGETVTLKDNQSLRAGLAFLKRLRDEDLLYYYSGWNQYLNAFQSGKTAAVVSGCWLTPSVAAGKDLAGKWQVVRTPRLDGVSGARNASSQGGSQWYVNAYSVRSDLAAAFLAETFGSDRDLINELAQKIGLITTMKDAEGLASYNEGDPFFGGQKLGRDFVSWNAEVPPLSFGPYTKIIENLVVEASQRVLNGEDMDAVLEEIQENAAMQIAY